METENGKLATNRQAETDQISSHIEGGFAYLKCAEHGQYVINPIGIEPHCSFHGSMSEMETKCKKLSW